MTALEPLVIEPIVLDGKQVRLEPLALSHLDALCVAGLYPELWRWIPNPIRNADDMRAYIETALKWRKEGSALPFVIVERGANEVIGSTRFANIDKVNKHVEIGWTWITPRWQRSAVNTETKFLLLRHAFETLGCNRVEFKTDALNAKSRAALKRIGATEEGTFRSHMIVQAGRVRDTVYFSIIAREWPGVKRRLEEMMRRT
jgi:RimJ/RimL family protein N-acetyltransferase